LAPDHPKKRIFAYWQHQPLCKACCRSTAKRQAKMMDDGVQPCRASRRWCQYAFGEALGEDLATA
jgi:hypothetical protein